MILEVVYKNETNVPFQVSKEIYRNVVTISEEDNWIVIAYNTKENASESPTITKINKNNIRLIYLSLA